MSNQPPVRLTLYEEKLREGLLAFQLPAEQAEFTGLPEETIDGALQDEGKVPVVIMAGEKPVGFLSCIPERISPTSTTIGPKRCCCVRSLLTMPARGKGLPRLQWLCCRVLSVFIFRQSVRWCWL